MFSALLSALNTLIYTLLAFAFPLYCSIKALLRQYAVSIVAPTSFASGSVDNFDDSEVPSTFIHPTETLKQGLSYSLAVSPSTITSTPQSQSATSWLHYWSLLAVIHCVTGLYELLLLPFLGNSLLYYTAKYSAIYWLARDDAKAARGIWTAVLAPFAAKYEKEADHIVQVCKSQGRVYLAKSITSLRQFSLKSGIKSSLKVE